MPGRNGQNQRNYYRILFVQPDAPPAIIQAAYRTLMQVRFSVRNPRW